ncbi:tetratricopeptide repeat protein [Geovibrio thiophilus]|uniref:Tetratricopeptide repeat protein n=1 Tax=Geovibrio thiophilus TaxID=139438 RepID=A0A3R5X4B7_9BACT|nr:CDC27 family protein [Geovibrio thiophilus]QAR34110.1 tetratricopeptide repeat protein [Geovibrio thiophilus]
MRLYVLILAAALAACAPKAALELQKNGREALAAGNAPLAAGYLEKAVQEHDSGENRALLGDAYFAMKEYDRAFYEYTRAVNRNKNTAYLHYKRGEILFILEKYNEAIMELDEALTQKPLSFARANTLIGLAYAELGNTKQAFFYLNRGIEAQENSTEAYLGRSKAYMKAGSPEQAIVDVTRAIQLDPKNAEAYFQRAQILFAVSKTGDGIKDLETALILDHNMEKAFSEAAWVLSTHPDPYFRDGAKAVIYGRKAYALKPDNENAVRLAAAFAENDQFDKAVSVIDEQISKEKDLVEVDGLRVWKEMYGKGIKYRRDK